jgi:hypothetical protein
LASARDVPLYLIAGYICDADGDIIVATALVGQGHQLPRGFGGGMSTGDLDQFVVADEVS